MFKQKPDIKLWIGIAISAFFLVLLFRKIDFDKLATAFSVMDCRFLPPALVLTFISYYLRAVRWKFLLLPIQRTRMSNLFPATLIGYMANNLLPARLGEFVRAYTLGRKEGIGSSAVFASLVLDRLCDGFTVLAVPHFFQAGQSRTSGTSMFRFMASFNEEAEPRGPICMILLAIGSRIGRAFSMRSGSPPR